MQVQDFTPKSRIQTQIEASNARRVEWQKELIAKYVWQCCLNCSEWNDGKALPNTPMGCTLHKGMPPPEVFVVGCKDYTCDIPF